MAATNSGAVSRFERVLKVSLCHMLRGRPYMCQALNERVEGSKNISLSIHNTRYDGIFFSDGEDSCLFLNQHPATISTINLSGFITPVAVCRKPNTIPLCLSIDTSREKLLVSHRAPPQVADRGTLTRYGGYRGNKIPGVDQN
jgi:hypothetical protein